MVSNHSVEVIRNHVNEISSILALPDKNFRKFYKLFSGEKISVEETNEGKLLLVQMLCKTIDNDITEVLKNEKYYDSEEQPSFFDSEE